jgi:hypothetical protein
MKTVPTLHNEREESLVDYINFCRYAPSPKFRTTPLMSSDIYEKKRNEKNHLSEKSPTRT